VCSGPPTWKRLISRPLATRERTSLITVIFSDSSEAEAVRLLCGDDAQAFVDVIDEVSPRILSSQQNRPIDFDPNFRVPPIRRWIASSHRYKGSA
jgi:hypothetical protein